MTALIFPKLVTDLRVKLLVYYRPWSLSYSPLGHVVLGPD